jgi:hypothetical protein
MGTEQRKQQRRGNPVGRYFVFAIFHNTPTLLQIFCELD